MTVYRFPTIKMQRSTSGACPICGKRVRRSRTFEATVNPFNQNADGTIKTPDEVRAQVREKSDAWVPDFTHDACLDESR